MRDDDDVDKCTIECDADAWDSGLDAKVQRVAIL